MLLAWIRTIVDFRSYHPLAQVGAGRLGLFALWLVLMNVLIFNTYFIFKLHKHLPAFLHTLPELTFSDGKLISPQQRTFVTLAPTSYQLVFDGKAQTPPESQEFTDKKIAAFFGADNIYMLSIGGVQAQPIPSSWNAAINSQTIEQYAGGISAMLQMFAFLGSILSAFLFLTGSIILSRVILSLWRGIRRQKVPGSILWKWAILLQGPAMALWTLNLFVTVPLFLFALFILFMMYSQQIYNTLPEK